MIRMGIVGLGKMGLSHLAMLRAHPDVSVDAVVDSTGYVLDVLSKNTGLATYGSLEDALRRVRLDAVLIATPTRMHAPMVRSVVDQGLHVFCEKPLTLSSLESESIADAVDAGSLVGQVGYHNRFVGTFREVKRLLDAGAIGRVTHLRVEAYGPVVLRSTGSTWRSQRTEGGGCLYDYAAHPLDLAVWYAGEPLGVGGSVLNSIFSENTDDEVYSTIHFRDGVSAQVSVNWSDESYRKMTTQVTITGTAGRIHADRQEIQVYRRGEETVAGYGRGWTVRNTTELTDPVWFYLRGEEYSAQIDHFVRRIQDPTTAAVNDFRGAATTDRLIEMISLDARGEGAAVVPELRQVPRRRSWRSARKVAS